MTSSSSIVFLTGASSGIGAATARLLVQKGHRVFACARRREKLEELATSLPEPVRDSLAIRVLDVLDVEDHRKAVAECVDRFGGLDVAVPNAGLGIFDNLGEAALEDWHTMVDVNVKGVLTTLHCCLPLLREAKGLVVNIGSV
ncbi:MAG: SDR family NAD(P)-dependent oxidoreductase, partial [Bacteroidota bacterium]|nr:SDR family NAD(P)-dependent oxidoreductase [Bacteroidota bacterium]